MLMEAALLFAHLPAQSKSYGMELEKALDMRKQQLQLLGLKKMLSKRKERDGGNTYQKTLDRVTEAENGLKKWGDKSELDGLMPTRTAS